LQHFFIQRFDRWLLPLNAAQALLAGYRLADVA